MPQIEQCECPRRQRPAGARVFLGRRSWVPYVLVLAALPLAGQRAGAELTQSELAELVRPSIELKSHHTDADGRVVEKPQEILHEYDQDIVAYPSGGGVPENVQSLDFPWEAQLFLEAFKVYHPALAKKDPWKTFLRKGEGIVAKELSLIRHHQGKAETLRQQLEDQNDELEKAFLAALVEYGRIRGKTAGPGAGAAGDYNVEFRLNPKHRGATIAIIGEGRFKADQKAGQPESWRDIADGQTTPLKFGYYIVKATWPGGQAARRRILVEKDDTIGIEPEK
jgi:hypothetical protein